MPGRQYSLVGDAELDEGACWEAILDPMVAELGEVVWIVDLNRQSLDRVVPNIGAPRLQGMFAAAGWQVLTVKYGRLLDGSFARPGGDALRDRIDEMTNPEYQRLLRCRPAELRDRLPGGGAAGRAARELVAGLATTDLHAAIRNLGGHDLAALGDAFAAIDDTPPDGDLRLHRQGLRPADRGPPAEPLLAAHRRRRCASWPRGWARTRTIRGPGSPAAARRRQLCAAAAARLRREPPSPRPARQRPDRPRPHPARHVHHAGRARPRAARPHPAAPEAARRVVTVSPDVSSSTNLGGWVNKVGVWSPRERVDWFADDPETILHWRERPTGQHIELGIAETNLVGLLGELGATWSRWGQPLLPIGVLYDPFVGAALEPWSFGIYAGGQSILVGTPSGVTLAPEGGAHQSITTPSIGLEQPGCISYEPAFAHRRRVDAAGRLARLGRPAARRPTCGCRPGRSTRRWPRCRPIRPPGSGAGARWSPARYPLRRARRPALTIAAMGAMVPEALAAADRLAAVGVGCDVVCVTSPGPAVRRAAGPAGAADAPDWILERVFPAGRAPPLVTVLDGHPHTLAFLAGINQVPSAHLGVRRSASPVILRGLPPPRHRHRQHRPGRARPGGPGAAPRRRAPGVTSARRGCRCDGRSAPGRVRRPHPIERLPGRAGSAAWPGGSFGPGGAVYSAGV